MSGTVSNNLERGSGIVGASGSGITISSGDPAVDTNPSGGVGTVFTNTTSGETYICTTATAGANVWTNVGDGTGDIAPITWFGGRGLCVAGAAGGTNNTIQYITIASTGDSTDFGDLTRTTHSGGACSDGSRGVEGGGHGGTDIGYVTIASTGNAIDFGVNLTQHRYLLTATSNDTRGIFLGGIIPWTTNICDYVTIQTTGACADFGDLSRAKYGNGSFSNGTRAFAFGGYILWTAVDDIEFVNFASLGNATDFGDLSTSAHAGGEGVEDLTRGVMADTSAADSDNLTYVTMASNGNASAFGGLHTLQYESGGVTNGSGGRGVWMGGQGAAADDTMQYITIASTGDAADFGDLTINVNDYNAGCSGD